MYRKAGLRHKSDGPSIGIILCKGKNEVIVEYALRDSSKPMGVAEYRLSAALPESLQAELPTEAEFAREFPLMALVKLRIEIEQELRGLINDTAFVDGPLSIGAALVKLTSSGRAPQNTPQFRAALRILNQAAHGIDVDTGAAAEATDVAARFLADLRANRPGGSHTGRT